MNNKIWSWTDKQKRKRIRSRRLLGPAPKQYRQAFWKKNRVKNKEALIKELNGEHGSFSLRTERHKSNLLLVVIQKIAPSLRGTKQSPIGISANVLAVMS